MTSGPLPQYQVRTSPRARKVRIKVSPLGRIEVVLPVGIDPRSVPQLLHQRRDWLSCVLKRIDARQRSLPESHGLQPRYIELPAIDEVWRLEYRQTLSSPRLKQSGPYRLSVEGDMAVTSVVDVLRQWLQQRARQVLPPWIHQVSVQSGLGFNKVTIRGQKTRWGSCSARHNINLNRNLLFLPADTVHYLFIHELCHTVYMDHSKNFWRLVEQYVADYRQHEKVMCDAAISLPLWIYD